MTICERCRSRTEVYLCRSVDEYLCDDCIEQLADEERALEYEHEDWLEDL